MVHIRTGSDREVREVRSNFVEERGALLISMY